METDLLARTDWWCCQLPAGVGDPANLDLLGPCWYPAEVPGTAASAMRAAGVPGWQTIDYDAVDWWFRCRVGPMDQASVGQPHEVRLGGVAGIVDLWVGGELVRHTENTFRTTTVELTSLAEDTEIVIRCSSLAAALGSRRPRPRWRTGLVANQQLRWIRTTLLGRMPGWSGSAAPVGPFRPITLTPIDRARVRVVDHTLDARLEGGDGLVTGSIALSAEPRGAVRVHVAGRSATLQVMSVGGLWRAQFTVRVPEPDLWWPHTHGDQPRYPVVVDVDGQKTQLAAVGFRSITVDRDTGRFLVSVNGTEVFCRGACWVPLDAVALSTSADQTRASVAAARDANINMLRVTGTTVYESKDFFDACDELGVLVWQDCMLASMDPPDTEEFREDFGAELAEQFGLLQGRPCLAVVSGGSELEQQAAMSGADRSVWSLAWVDDVVGQALKQALPGVEHVSSSPSGGDPPFRVDTGVAHYFGVGAYRRPLSDARRADVQFAAECLAFAIPPEVETVDEVFGGAAGAGHHPRWKAAVPRDGGTPWDFDDVRDHYVRELYGVDANAVRVEDPERYLDLGRAAVAECVTATFSEWRRHGSTCGGGLILSLRDLVPGAGWGLIDACGRPKSAWYAARRVFAPIALLATDEGLNGLDLHAVNDTAVTLQASVVVNLFVGANAVETSSIPVALTPRSSVKISVGSMFPGFRDLTYAYRFGALEYDTVYAELVDAAGRVLDDVVFFPGGGPATPDSGVGLSAVADCTDGQWTLTLGAERAARWVSIQADGFTPSDSWFHLAPGVPRRIALSASGDVDRPRGVVTAINGRGAPIVLAGAVVS